MTTRRIRPKIQPSKTKFGYMNNKQPTNSIPAYLETREASWSAALGPREGRRFGTRNYLQTGEGPLAQIFPSRVSVFIASLSFVLLALLFSGTAFAASAP